MIPMLHSLISNFAAACAPGSGGSFLGFPTWYKYLDGETVAGKCSPVMKFPDDIGEILLAVVEILLRVGGLVAVAFVIYGGLRFILSQGDPEKAASARKTIINSLIGTVIALLATLIVSFIARSLT